MPEITVSAGRIEYTDTGGNGPVVVLLHGLLADRWLWDDTVAALGPGVRCVVPTLPLGAHRIAMHPDAGLTVAAVAALVGELLDALDLLAVTLVGNDTGGALVQLLAAARHPRIGAIALVACDAFDDYPPGLTGRTLVALGRLPLPVFGLAVQQLRLRVFRRLPIAFGWLTRRGDARIRASLRPLLTVPDVRRDAVAVLRSIAADHDILLRLGSALASYDRPALVVWATEDRVMARDHGRRLAALLPDARLVELDDTDTLVPLDRPDALAAAIRGFVRPD